MIHLKYLVYTKYLGYDGQYLVDMAKENDAVVAIAMKNGRTILYSATGRLIRS